MHRWGFLDSLRSGLKRSREAINEIFYMGGEVDEDFWEDLEGHARHGRHGRPRSRCA